MLKVIVTVNLLILLTACSTTYLPRARCDVQLVPINSPAVEGAENLPQGTRDHNGDQP